MRQNDGFTLTEVLVAFSIILLLVTTFLPIGSLIRKESVALSEYRQIGSVLHDELQPFLWLEESKIPASYTKQINDQVIVVTMVDDGELIKGCAQWESIKSTKETICLYGYRKGAGVYSSVDVGDLKCDHANDTAADASDDTDNSAE